MPNVRKPDLHMVQFRVSSDTLEKIRTAARARGLTQTVWLRIVADEAAARDIAQKIKDREDLERYNLNKVAQP